MRPLAFLLVLACRTPDAKDDNPVIDTDPDAVVEICNGLDDDGDGLTDAADPDLDPASAVQRFRDFDQDGYGDEAAMRCPDDPGYSAQSGDCDDTDPTVNPGAIEVCDFIDQDCSGVADDGLPDLDGSGTSDCREVAILLSDGHVSHDLDFWTCDGALPVARELTALAEALDDIGLGGVRYEEGDAITAADLSGYAAVLLHTGGWADALQSSTVDLLLALEPPLIVIGDDVGLVAENTELVNGRDELYDLLHIASVEHNGNEEFKGLGADTPGTHPVLAGPFGSLTGFPYAGDFDHLTLTSEGETVLLSKETVGAPVAWLLRDTPTRSLGPEPLQQQQLPGKRRRGPRGHRLAAAEHAVVGRLRRHDAVAAPGPTTTPTRT